MAKKIDIKTVYEDRLKQIELDVAKAVYKKDWNRVNSLRSEQKRLRELI